MKGRTRKALDLSGEHAAHAISILVSEGKIMARDVEKALRRREGLIQELRDKLAALGDEGAAIMARVRGKTRKTVRKGERKPKRRMSAARRAALKLHGKYIGSVRTLPKRAKAKVKVIREKSGVHAAIKAAKKMAK